MQIALLCKPMLAPNTTTITTRACRLVKVPKAPITAQRFEIEIMNAPPILISEEDATEFHETQPESTEDGFRAKTEYPPRSRSPIAP